MRTFELLMIFANLLYFLRRLLPTRYRGARLPELSSAVAVLMVILHLLLEGYRWQMIPAYALTAIAGTISLGAFLRRDGAPSTKENRLKDVLLSLTGVLILGLTAALGTLFPIPKMPELTGPYAVGTTTYHWVDPTRLEIYTDDPEDVRELMVQIWYPAEPEPRAQPGPWMADADLATPAIAKRIELPPFLLSHLNLVRTRAFPDAPFPSSGERYPVLFFSHGWGGIRTQNTTQVEELASHGYVVVAMDHTYGSAVTVFPNQRVALWNQEALPSDVTPAEYERAANRLVNVWSQDLRFAVDQLSLLDREESESRFAGRLDLEKIGVMGHSTGGGTAVEMCHLDDRCKVGLAMDAWLEPVSPSAIESSLQQPFMFMRSADWDQAGFNDRNDQLQTEVLSRLQGDGYRLTIAGTKHFDYSSFPLLSPLMQVIGFKGTIEGGRVVEIVNTYSVAFFNRYLKGQSTPLLTDPSQAYPEVLFQSLPGE